MIVLAEAVERFSSWMVVSRDALVDAVELQKVIFDAFRKAELAERGFLGLIRCDRCHRPVRCVYFLRGTVRHTEGDGWGEWEFDYDRFYGRSCFQKVKADA